MKHIVFVILCAINMITLYGLSESERYRLNLDELRNFLHRYRCSQDIEEQLSNNSTSHHFGPTSDGKFYLKDGNVSRLVNAIRLQRFMQDNGITGIDIPQKCWSRRLHRVVSSAMPHMTIEKLKESGRKLTLEEVQKLVKIIEGTALNDLNYPNLCLSINGRLSLIDLEDKSFFSSSIFAGVRRGLYKLSGWPMEVEAEEWLNKRYEEVEKIEEAKDWDDRIRESLQCNTRYDDKDIDFNKAKKASIGFGFFCPEKK